MRHAVRSLLKARAFAGIAVATLAIGIGSTTAVFSIVDAVLLRPLPFKDAARLVVLSRVNVKRGVTDAPFSYAAYQEVSSRARSYESISALASDQFNMTGIEHAEELPGARVSASFFDVIGVSPAAGRSFSAQDDTPGGPAVVVLGRRFWARRFGADPRVVGNTLILNGAPHLVVGALGIDLPPPFADVDIWTTRPEAVSGFSPALVASGLGYLTAVARIAPRVGPEHAQAELDTITSDYARANPANTDADPDSTMRPVPVRERGVGSMRAPLLLLTAAVGLVLLVACANFANLLFVRATARSQEAALRLALGASQWDLSRWLCAESLVLALTGGFAGVVAARWAVSLASGSLAGLLRGSEVAVDGRVLIVSLAVSIAAGLLVGLAPLRRATTQPPIAALRAGSRGSTRHRGGAAAVLVVGEVAMSLVLLVVAGLLLQSLAGVLTTPVGFRSDGLLTTRVSLPTSRYADPAALRSFMNRLMVRLQATPGVVSASASMDLPPNPTIMAPFQPGDRPQVAIGKRPVGVWSGVTPGYFATMGIPLLKGRGFTDADTESTRTVVVVSADLAQRLWPNESPLGKTLLVGRRTDFAEVVGVVGDVRNAGQGVAPMPEMYTPYAQRPWSSMGLVVRAANGEGLALVNGVRAAVSAIDPDQPVTGVQTMDAALSDSVATARVTTALVAAFAVVALAMAAAGLYGVIAYTVEQRTREIGVRIALGAESRAVLALVAGHGGRLAFAGVAVGGVAAMIVTRVARGLVFGISSGDPAVYAAVVGLFMAVAGAACVVPARRALRVDPSVALRAE
jgi:putative ABC transport system permease protein